MSNIYVTSDTHFGHSKNFLYEPRGFNNIYDHDNTIIKNWNEIVNPEDDVYLLGDVMLNDNNYGISCLKQLKGNIHIIRGNHCTDSRLKLYADCWNVIEVCDAKFLKIGKQTFFLPHYPCLTSNYDDNKPLNRCIINLCGHVHTLDKWLDWNNGLIYHVEMDAHDCRPISVEQIINDIKKKIEEGK